MTLQTLQSHAGTNGCRVLSADYTDRRGRTWPKGTAYRPISSGMTTIDRDGQTVQVRQQTIAIESRHYQTVLESGFGETVEFILD